MRPAIDDAHFPTAMGCVSVLPLMRLHVMTACIQCSVVPAREDSNALPEVPDPDGLYLFFVVRHSDTRSLVLTDARAVAGADHFVGREGGR